MGRQTILIEAGFRGVHHTRLPSTVPVVSTTTPKEFA
jgi:hypothetical protein